MMYVPYSAEALFALCLSITTSFASVPGSHPAPLSFVIKRRNISASETSKGFDNNIIVSSRSNPVEAPTTTLGPDWPIFCAKPTPMAQRLDQKDCLTIASQIETSPGATSFRIYSGEEGRLHWGQGSCSISMGGLTLRSTDVFKPVLIARDIRRVLGSCVGNGRGGVTNVGPRRKFILIVSNFMLDANETVATS